MVYSKAIILSYVLGLLSRSSMFLRNHTAFPFVLFVHQTVPLIPDMYKNDRKMLT